MNFDSKVDLFNKVGRYMRDHGMTLKEACSDLDVDLKHYYNVRGYVRVQAKKMSASQIQAYGLDKELLKPIPPRADYARKRMTDDLSSMHRAYQVVESEKKPSRTSVDTLFATIDDTRSRPSIPESLDDGYREITLKLNAQFYEMLEKQAKHYGVPVESLGSILLHVSIGSKLTFFG